MQDLQYWRLAIDVVSLVALLFSMVAGVYAWKVRREQVGRDSLEALKSRLAVMETKVEMLPGQESWRRMAEQIGALSVDIRGLQAEIHGHGVGLKRVENQVGLLLENEIKGSRT